MPRLITLGGLSVRNGKVVNGLANPRSRLAILAVLAVAGDRGVRREKLAAMFWPESDDEKARNALRQALFTLRRDFGSGDITLGTGDLRLNSEVLTADVTEFDVAVREERFEDAAALYAGPFLDGVYLRESPEFERWADEQRSRLSREYDRTLEKAAAAAASRGDLRSAAGWWERRSAHDPLSGRVARLYMEALAAAGDRERAIRHAAVHAQLVRQELEAEPDAEVIKLADRLRELTAKPGAAGDHTGEATSPLEVQLALSRDLPDAMAVGATPTGTQTGSRAESTRRRSLARVALFGAPLLAAGIYLALTTSRPESPTSFRTVAITAFANETGDSTLGFIGDLIRTEIIAGFTESRLADVMPREVVDSLTSRHIVSNRSRLRDVDRQARHIISGRYAFVNDSLYIHTELTDAMHGSVSRTLMTTAAVASEPIVTARAVRGNVLAAMAMRLDPRLHDLADVLTPPANFDAYDRFAEGLRQSGPDSEQRALEYFREAVTLDPGFFVVNLWSVFFGVLAAPKRDSVLSMLEAHRGKLTEFERAWLDYHLIVRDADPRRRFLGAARLSQLAPRSDWFHWVYANDAGRIGRYDDAVAALERIDPAGPWITRIYPDAYWAFLRHLLHARGQHARALLAVRTAMGFRPDLNVLRRMELMELAALGRMAEVDHVLNRIEEWSQSPIDGSRQLIPYVMVAEEFSAHGHRREAIRVAAKFDSVLALLPDSARNRAGMTTLRARVMITLGRYDEALAALGALGPRPSWETLSRMAIASAAAGKREEADSAASALVEMSQGRMRPVACARVAQAYALMGDRSRATAAFRDAILAGADWSSLRHDPPAADSFRRYPEPEALVRERHLSPTSCVKTRGGT